MIRAIVTVRTSTHRIRYDAIGFSAAAIDASARELYGALVGVSVMVQA